MASRSHIIFTEGPMLQRARRPFRAQRFPFYMSLLCTTTRSVVGREGVDAMYPPMLDMSFLVWPDSFDSVERGWSSWY